MNHCLITLNRNGTILEHSYSTCFCVTNFAVFYAVSPRFHTNTNATSINMQIIKMRRTFAWKYLDTRVEQKAMSVTMTNQVQPVMR